MKNLIKIIILIIVIIIIYSCSSSSGVSYYKNSKTTDNNTATATTNNNSSNLNNPLSKFNTNILKASHKTLLDKGNNSAAARYTEIELEKRGVYFENKSSTGFENFSFNNLIKTRETLKASNQDTSLIDDEIKNREKTGITETVVVNNVEESYGNSLEELTQTQEKALGKKDYLLAAKIEKQIKAFKNKPTPKNLEIQKQEALKNKDYLLADKLEKQIQSLESVTDKKQKLEADKQEAIKNKDYLLADKLEKNIQKLDNKKDVSKTETTSLANLSSKKQVKKGTNLRETSLLEILDDYNTSTNNNTSNSNNILSFTSTSNNSKAKVKRHSSNTNQIKYRRSSLYTMMIQNTKREHSEIIKNTFGDETISTKFNDHNIGPYLIHSNAIIDDQSGNIEMYLNTNDVAKKLVSKWFNRNERGEFNMQLVAERGNYNATDLDVVIARNNERGEAMLADAGEELIANTFVIINDYKFTNKAEKAKKAGGWLKITGNLLEAAGVPNASLIGSGAALATQGALNGYWVKTTSYLYKLVWDEETAAIFYNDYWIDENNYNESKKQAFDNSNFLRLKYIGSQNARRGVAVSGFSSKSSNQLIKIATINATNKAISKLERRYDTFKTKSPIIGVNPVAAKIGLKEGLEKGDKFEVLEQVLDKKERITYKRVGVVTVDKRHIWDNTFNINKQNSSTFEYTTFKGNSKKFQVGMFLRQIN